MVFTGTLAQFFPEELAASGSFPKVALREPGPSALGLEGDRRPGHFAGVATIVARLFEIVRPDRAYFGQKDFQQTLVVRDLARGMGYPEIVVRPTVRESSGLAMTGGMSSSRPRAPDGDGARARQREHKAAWGWGARPAPRCRACSPARRSRSSTRPCAIRERGRRGDRAGRARGRALSPRASSRRLIDNEILRDRGVRIDTLMMKVRAIAPGKVNLRRVLGERPDGYTRDPFRRSRSILRRPRTSAVRR
jgi:hypothetical protein